MVAPISRYIPDGRCIPLLLQMLSFRAKSRSRSQICSTDSNAGSLLNCPPVDAPPVTLQQSELELEVRIVTTKRILSTIRGKVTRSLNLSAKVQPTDAVSVGDYSLTRAEVEGGDPPSQLRGPGGHARQG